MFSEQIPGFQETDRKSAIEEYNIESPDQAVWLKAVIQELILTASGFRKMMQVAQNLEQKSPTEALAKRKKAAEIICNQYDELEQALEQKNDSLAISIITQLGIFADKASEVLGTDDSQALENFLGGNFSAGDSDADPRTDLERYIEDLETQLQKLTNQTS